MRFTWPIWTLIKAFSRRCKNLKLSEENFTKVKHLLIGWFILFVYGITQLADIFLALANVPYVTWKILYPAIQASKLLPFKQIAFNLLAES